MDLVGASGRAQGQPSIQRQWPAATLRLADVRRVVSQWLGANRMTPLEDSVSLAVTELLSNARSASAPDDPIVLRLELDGSWVSVEVENQGCDFEPDYEMPSPRQRNGRGLPLVSGLAEDVEVCHQNGRTTVAARFRQHTSSERSEPPAGDG